MLIFILSRSSHSSSFPRALLSFIFGLGMTLLPKIVLASPL